MSVVQRVLSACLLSASNALVFAEVPNDQILEANTGIIEGRDPDQHNGTVSPNLHTLITGICSNPAEPELAWARQCGHYSCTDPA